MLIKNLAGAALMLALAACANGIPKDTSYSNASDDAIVVLPNATGHVLLTSVDPKTQTADGRFSEYLAVSGDEFTVERVPAGTYIFTSHSFYYSEVQPLRFECLRTTAPVFQVKAGTVNLAPMVDPGRWNGFGSRIEKETWRAKADEILLQYPNIQAPLEQAAMVAVARPISGKGFPCMKDSYQTILETTNEG